MLRTLKFLGVRLASYVLGFLERALRKAVPESNHIKTLFDARYYLSEVDSDLELKNFSAGNITCSPNRYVLMADAVSKIENIESGLVCEFGVFEGKSINWLAYLLPNKTIYGFDSFEGLPEPWNDCKVGMFKVDTLPEVRSNVSLVEGYYKDTIPAFVQEHRTDIAFLHADSDLYSSTKTIFDLLGQKIKPGTIILFDEYHSYPDWRGGEYKAFNEFIRDNNLGFDYIGWCLEGQAAIRITSGK